MRVRSLMSTTVYSCTADQTLDRAARLLWEHDLGCVPVVDAGGRPVAMLTDRDICMAAYLRGAPIAEIDIASAMSTDLFTCHVDDALSEAERTMMTRQVRRLPVVDDEGKLVAVLSLNDIVPGSQAHVAQQGTRLLARRRQSRPSRPSRVHARNRPSQRRLVPTEASLHTGSARLRAVGRSARRLVVRSAPTGAACHPRRGSARCCAFFSDSRASRRSRRDR